MKNSIKRLILIFLVPIGIGAGYVILGGGSSDAWSPSFHLRSVLYSLSIGLPLAANGMVYRVLIHRFIDWIARPVRSASIAILVHLSYSAIVILLVNWVWFYYRPWAESIDFWSLYRTPMIVQFLICVLILSILYTYAFFESLREEALEHEEERSQALALRYKVLQEQVSPHFLFNSLNILESLIDVDADKARHFTRTLSLLYRDILQFKDLDIIPVEKELSFIEKYIELQKIRFGDVLHIHIEKTSELKGQLIPLTLQVLIENAIKHNEVSRALPLQIDIMVGKDESVEVKNKCQPKTEAVAQSGIGLTNLSKRYHFLTEREIEVVRKDNIFRVRVPLIYLDT